MRCRSMRCMAAGQEIFAIPPKMAPHKIPRCITWPAWGRNHPKINPEKSKKYPEDCMACSPGILKRYKGYGHLVRRKFASRVITNGESPHL